MRARGEPSEPPATAPATNGYDVIPPSNPNLGFLGYAEVRIFFAETLRYRDSLKCIFAVVNIYIIHSHFKLFYCYDYRNFAIKTVLRDIINGNFLILAFTIISIHYYK